MIEVPAASLCAECKGVLRAGADAGAEEEPGAAGVPPPAGEQDPPAQGGRCSRQTGFQQRRSSFFCPLTLSCSTNWMLFLLFLLKANSAGVIPCIDINPAGGPNQLPSHASGYGPLSCFSPPSPNPEAGWREEEQGGGGGGGGGARQGASGDSRQEVQDLKEQLEALRCQVGPPSPPTPHSSPPHSPNLPLSRTASRNVPSSDALRAEQMSIHCCQGEKKKIFCSELSWNELVNCTTKWLLKMRRRQR